MRSVVFDGHPLRVHVRDIPKANIARQTDAVVRVTSAAICGSDLHNYHGVFGSDRVPYPIGHEAMGIVEKVGEQVDSVNVGDRVIIPDIPDGVGLDLEPAINPAVALYGEGSEFGNLGGCQGTIERCRIMFSLVQEDLCLTNHTIFNSRICPCSTCGQILDHSR